MNYRGPEQHFVPAAQATANNDVISQAGTQSSNHRAGRGRRPHRGGHSGAPLAGTYPNFNNFVAAYNAHNPPQPLAEGDIPNVRASQVETTSTSANRRPRGENRGSKQPRRGPKRETTAHAHTHEPSSTGETQVRQPRANRNTRQGNRRQRGSAALAAGSSVGTPDIPDATNTTAPTTAATTATTSASQPTKFVPKNNNFYRNQARRTTDADDLQATIGDHTLLASKIIVKLNQNTYECMVCYDVIGRRAPVWWCQNCYALFHLNCVDKWSAKAYEGGKGSWRCPGCQGPQDSVPESRCFCNKVANPPFDPYNLAHSCGENCSKVRGVGCPHLCPLLCHPGPCPPCTIMGATTSCFCGKESYRLRCGEVDKGRSCDQICSKQLSCGKHFCDQHCHSGVCTPCDKLVPLSCYCGKTVDNRVCGKGVVDTSQGEERFFKCNSICGRQLACGKHQCEDLCHTGPCKECLFLPSKISTCPCGSTLLSVVRKTCVDPVPTCNSICNKILPCGKHSCVSKCHTSECPPCMKDISVKCRCHTTSAVLTCSSVLYAREHPVICSKVCNKERSCGRHKCGIKCCSSLADPTDPDGNHVCTLVCGKLLGCGVHTCDNLCHKGRCHPCSRVSYDELTCTCGKTITYPPVACGTPIPTCRHPCQKQRSCGHVDVLSHECHPGACPPCAALTERMCAGGHEMRRNIRCSQIEVSCGSPCAKPLPCGVHSCAKTCHSGACAPASAQVGVSCGNKCGTKLSGCEHICQLPCHPGSTCPLVVCQQISKVTCICGRRTGEAVCNHSSDGLLTGQEAQPLPCDEQCELKERNKRLAEAFGVLPPGVKPPAYSDMLMNLTRVSPMLVRKFEQMFDEFLKTPPSNTKLNLPPMDRVKRQLLHELAKYYHLETQSMDKEPLRSVLVTKTRESRLPTVLLSEYVVVRQNVNSQPTPIPTSRIGPVTALHIYNLQSYVKTPHLVAFLQPFAGHYKLQWIDDGNCLALFDNELTMRTALSQLGGSMFAVKVYKDQLDSSPSDFHMTPLSTPAQTRSMEKDSSTKIRVPTIKSKEDDSWRKDDNTFKILNDDTSSTTSTTTTSSISTWDEDYVPPPNPWKKSTTKPGQNDEVSPKKMGDDIEADFKVIKPSEELDDWTLLDESTTSQQPPNTTQTQASV